MLINYDRRPVHTNYNKTHTHTHARTPIY